MFTYFGFCGSHCNSSVGSVKSSLQNLKSQDHCAHWRALTPELLQLGATLLTCWSIRVFEVWTPYQRNYLRSIKSWIVIYYRAIKVSQKALLLLTLEINAADTSFNGHSEWKFAVFKFDATKADVTENRICEGTDCLKAALSSGMTSLQVMVDSAKSVCWGSNEAVTLLYLVPWPSTPAYRVKTLFKTWFSQLTTLSIHIADNCFLYCFSGLWAFCQAVLFLTNVFATKIWSCYELDPLDIIHILGLITPNFLPTCVMIITALAIFQAWILVGVHIGKSLKYSQIRQKFRLFGF